ncbi:response regulator transcription factor [Laceyella tengchongensis]|uniref:response regulator transcription factor n=1 Tax=Laceyella tengchongensis TaxID=574699 RepID=UPI0012B6F046|nr:response regulator [Laceyella tengchongensis]
MRTEKILLIDDEVGILNMLEKILLKEGFHSIVKATSSKEALQAVETTPFDIIVLDVMLPDSDGFDLCRKLRNVTEAPILFLSARSSDFDKLTGLGIGGDDYITKPFNPLEVVARINAHLRRNSILKKSMQAKPTKWDFGSFSVNKETGQLFVNGKEVRCTAKEYDLMIFLCEHPNQIFTTSQLYEQVWDSMLMGDEKTVAVHVSKLRKKIEPDPKNPRFIVNLRGIGYKFVPPKAGERP